MNIWFDKEYSEINTFMRQKEEAMKSGIPIELVVPVLAALSCLLMKVGGGIPVWAVFLGWAWYFAMGATPSILKKIS